MKTTFNSIAFQWKCVCYAMGGLFVLTLILITSFMAKRYRLKSTATKPTPVTNPALPEA